MVEFWRTGGVMWDEHRRLIPDVGGRARRAEEEGWYCQLAMDTQSLCGDPYVVLTAAALATERLMLSTGVTNTFTRHVAVTAGAIATLQAVSGGRAVLGIARGDSALAYLGRAPVPPEEFARQLQQIQALLLGETISFDEVVPNDPVNSISRLRLAKAPESVSLRWVPDGLPKVPVEVFASGPKVICIGARHAERLTFAVGADPQRVRWAIETARGAVLPDTPLSLGAMVAVAVHPDIHVARRLGGGVTTGLARFTTLHGSVAGPLEPGDREVLQAVHTSYDMTRHGSYKPSELFSAQFLDRFAVVGRPEDCTERFLELRKLGLYRCVVITPRPVDDDDAYLSEQLLVREVMPAVCGVA